jgi:hypothetical protein
MKRLFFPAPLVKKRKIKQQDCSMPMRRKRFAAWIAAFAVILQALWPLLSHARPKDPSLLAPVCSIDGIVHDVELKAGSAPLGNGKALHDEHCKLCVFGGGNSAGIAGSNAAVLAVADCRDSQAVSRPAPLSEPAGHPPAQPRAPPEIS